jgi:hypothetical protein
MIAVAFFTSTTTTEIAKKKNDDVSEGSSLPGGRCCIFPLPRAVFLSLSLSLKAGRVFSFEFFLSVCGKTKKTGFAKEHKTLNYVKP